MHFILIITYVYVITYVCMLSISWVSKGRVRQNTASAGSRGGTKMWYVERREYSWYGGTYVGMDG